MGFPCYFASTKFAMTRALYVVLLLIQISAFSQDLVVTNYTGPTSFSRYEEIAQEITIKNAGIVDISKDFYTGAFLSSDNQWQASDIKLYDSYGYSVPSGSSYTHKASPLVEVTPGTYFLIFKVDHQGTVTETNEANNLLVIPNVVIGAANVDFTLTSFSLDKSTYTQNNLVKPSYVLQNLGTTNAGTYISTDFYLSTDATFSADDKNIGTEIELLKGPDNITSGTDLGFPLPTVANGSYFILAWVDSNYGSQRFAETNESNNKFAIPITIQSSSVDLEISNVLTLGTDGSQARLTIRNNGTTGVSGYSVSAQLVPQGNVPNSNYVTTHMNALNNYLGPHEEKTFDLFFPIHTTTPGTYYPVYYVNYDERVAETYFQNNQRYGAALVIAPPLVSALSFNGMSVAGLVDNTDQQINLNLDLTNTGTDDSFIQYVNLAVKNAQNTVVHSEQTYFYVNFAPGQTSTTALTINLASPLQTGSYSISVSCAYGCYLTPSSKTANFTVSLPQYTLTGTVIGEDGQPITNGKLFLYQDAGSGVIKFIQKVVPYVGPNFTFPVDVNRHTLYFIPDVVQHPEYVPTIYGKTVALQPGNFFTASSNMNVTLEVLKVNSPGAGTGIIHGRVASSASNPAGRETQPLSLEPVQDVPVILISGTGQIVGLTHTNALGEYQFNNLPRDVYKVVISLELDNASLMDPLRVDITEKNMNVDLVLKPDGTEPTISQFFLPQTVTFAEFRSYQYNDPAIALDAKSNVELPVEYISSDNSIAEVVNNEIVIKGVGTVIITAKQAGNTFYYPASVNRSLTITKANQALTIGSIPVKIFGDH